MQKSDPSHEGLRLFVPRHSLAMQLFQLRLVIERIYLAQAALEKNLDRPLRWRRVVWRRIGGVGRYWRTGGIARQQGRQCHAPQARGKLA
jgi:hypothetical protein